MQLLTDRKTLNFHSINCHDWKVLCSHRS